MQSQLLQIQYASCDCHVTCTLPDLNVPVVMSELLFECYNIPSLAYGVDALFSLYYNGTKFSGAVTCLSHVCHM